MEFNNSTLASLSLDGRGSYGIGAPAVAYSENLYTYLRITDIQDDGTLNLTDLKSVDYDKASQYILKPNDIVFARTGASTGRNYFYDGSDGEFVYAGFLIKFSIDPQKVNPKYIKYYCLSDFYKNWIHSFSTGSTRGNINAKTLGDMPIPIPSRSQQDGIVDILSCLDEKIKINKKINENLEKQTQAIFKAWFEDYILFNRTRPMSWKMGKLSDIAIISNGKRPPMKSTEKTEIATIPIVGATSIMGFTSKFNHNNKILVTGRVGTHGVIQRFNFPCWTSDNTLVITSNFYEYTYQILKRINYQSMNIGSTQPLITQSDMNKVKILIPEPTILDNFENIAGKLMTQYEANKFQNEKLATLRDTLLPKLISGELDVSNVKM